MVSHLVADYIIHVRSYNSWFVKIPRLDHIDNNIFYELLAGNDMYREINYPYLAVAI
jgi:hypothetical protein